MHDAHSLHPGAEHIGRFAHDTDAWHDIRRQGVGGSDAAILLGHSRWSSIKQLWELKTGRRRPEAAGDYARCGHLLEAAVREQAFLGQAHDGAELGTLRSKEHPVLLAHIDGVLQTASSPATMIEIKTSGKRWYRGVPDYYVDQVQHYMLVTGLTRAIIVCAEVRRDRRDVVAAIDAGETTAEDVVSRHCILHRYKLEQDLEWQARYIPLAEAFWARVEQDQWDALEP